VKDGQTPPEGKDETRKGKVLAFPFQGSPRRGLDPTRAAGSGRGTKRLQKGAQSSSSFRKRTALTDRRRKSRTRLQTREKERKTVVSETIKRPRGLEEVELRKESPS